MDDMALKFLFIGLLLAVITFAILGLVVFLWQRHKRRRIHIQKILPADAEQRFSKFNRRDDFPLGDELKESNGARNGFAQIFHGSPHELRKPVESGALPSPLPVDFLRSGSLDRSMDQSYRRVEEDVVLPAVEELRSVVVIRTDDYGGGIMIVEGQAEGKFGGSTNCTSIIVDSDASASPPPFNHSSTGPAELNAQSLWVEESSLGGADVMQKALRPFKIDLGSIESGDTIANADGRQTTHDLSLQSNTVEQEQEDDNGQIAHEFEELDRAGRSTIRPKSIAAEMGENIRKNRFYDILPYDFNRVKLKETASDYINASYIFEGGENDKTPLPAYIAAQGPIGDEEAVNGRRLPTVQDFWWMVWGENVDCIVMLTPCFEGIKPKCGRYWPENAGEMLEIGDGFSLLLYCVTEDEIWFQREIWLERRGHPRRRIIQWHFKEWNDFASPSDPAELLAFIETIRASERNKSAPLLVHCSAGVGRTGVFIAIDALLDRLANSKLIDVMGTVRMLRESRTSMVQNVEQYATIYEAIALAIRRTSGR